MADTSSDSGSPSGGSGASNLNLSSQFFSGAGAAVQDIFAGEADLAKAQGDLYEAQNYDLAAALAGKNVGYAQTATALKEEQSSREIFMTQSSEKAAIANSGFAEGGSGLDVLRDTAGQGALQIAALGQQGLITVQGYQEQQQSYLNLEAAANAAANAEKEAATGSDIMAGINAAKAAVSLVMLVP